MAARSREERIADSLSLLEAGDDAWAGYGSDGTPHLVIFSFAWDSAAREIVFCTEAGSRTVRNVENGAGSARVGIGGTRDVPMFDGQLENVGEVSGEPATAAFFAKATGRGGPRRGARQTRSRVARACGMGRRLAAEGGFWAPGVVETLIHTLQSSALRSEFAP